MISIPSFNKANSFLHHVFSFVLVLIVSFLFSVNESPVYAQENIDIVSLGGGVQEDSALLEEGNVMEAVRKEMQETYKGSLVFRPSIPSLLFLPAEHAMLQAAKASFLTRLPTETELGLADEDEVVTSIRDVSLGGILYTGETEWIVWINNQRITPNALPMEIIDIVVFKDYVNLKWFDRQTNRIYPIRLRPNQKFNFDARMFLPG